MMKKRIKQIGFPAVFALTFALSILLWKESESADLLAFIAGVCLLPSLLICAVAVLLLDRKEILPSIETFRRYIPLVQNLVSRDLKVKYRRSILGFLWSILNPLLMALVINTVFSHVFRFDVEYFATYYLCGSLIFNFMNEATSNCMTSVLNAAPLIRKVRLPKYIFALQKCGFSLLNMLFALAAVLVVMLIQGCPFRPTMLLFFVPMIYVFVFSFGVGLILSAVTVFFRDMLHLYSVFTVVWMYLTPIIYPESLVEDQLLGSIVRLNPMYYYTRMFREVMMYGTLPSASEHLIGIAFALGFLFLGIAIFKKLQDRFILYI